MCKTIENCNELYYYIICVFIFLLFFANFPVSSGHRGREQNMIPLGSDPVRPTCIGGGESDWLCSVGGGGERRRRVTFHSVFWHILHSQRSFPSFFLCVCDELLKTVQQLFVALCSYSICLFPKRFDLPLAQSLYSLFLYPNVKLTNTKYIFHYYIFLYTPYRVLP